MCILHRAVSQGCSHGLEKRLFGMVDCLCSDGADCSCSAREGIRYSLHSSNEQKKVFQVVDVYISQ